MRPQAEGPSFGDGDAQRASDIPAGALGLRKRTDGHNTTVIWMPTPHPWEVRLACFVFDIGADSWKRDRRWWSCAHCGDAMTGA